jgi:hypothetical protein
MLPLRNVQRVGFTVFGLGNLGSSIVRRLAKMGIRKFTLVDPDTVEASNVATQEYDDTYLGWAKVEAARSMIRKINGEAAVETYVGDHDARGLDRHWWPRVIVATDSIESRKLIWEQLIARKGWLSRTWVDVRMALENLEFTFLRGGGVHDYIDLKGEKTLEYVKALQDTDHLKLPCGARSIAYTGAAAAGVVCPHIRRYLLGLPTPYMVFADLGRSKMDAVWREGEEYTEEKFE